MTDKNSSNASDNHDSASTKLADPDDSQGMSKRRIKSFVLRQGRMTQGQRDAFASQWPLFGLNVNDGLLNFNQLYDREAPVILEIGFGNGASFAKMAQASPAQNYLGVEVHKPGIGALMIQIEKEQLCNIRVYHEDAIKVLHQCIADNSLSGVQLFFPDPWHKRRHNKRRIIQTEFIELIAKKLKVGGYFHMATDWQDYAKHMMTVMTSSPLYTNKFEAGHYAPRPESRPLTKFEQRGHGLGHGVWDLIFIRE